MTSFQTVPKSS